MDIHIHRYTYAWRYTYTDTHMQGDDIFYIDITELKSQHNGLMSDQMLIHFAAVLGVLCPFVWLRPAVKKQSE